MSELLDTLHQQVRSWNDGDLDGYLAHVHPDVVYQHGGTVLHGRDALREHYRGRVEGILRVRVLRVQQLGDTAVIAVAADLGTWRGSALLTWIRAVDRWLLLGDAWSHAPPSCPEASHADA